MILRNRRLCLRQFAIMGAAIMGAAFMGLAVSGPTALAAGDGIEGRKVAIRWCAACHVVTEDQAAATADAPPFSEVREKHQGNMDFLESFLTQTHPNMPDMNLSTLEIRNLIAFIEGK